MDYRCHQHSIVEEAKQLMLTRQGLSSHNMCGWLMGYFCSNVRRVCPIEIGLAHQELLND